MMTRFGYELWDITELWDFTGNGVGGNSKPMGYYRLCILGYDRYGLGQSQL